MNFYAEIARFSYPYIGNKYLRFYRLPSLEISFLILAYFMLGGIVRSISLIYNSQTILIREYWLFYLFVLIIIFFPWVN